MAEYRVDQLAQACGTSVRNVRYYQDIGILPAPRREGRVGVYSDAHLARLRLITRLLARGYTAANITELLNAWEQGRDLSDVLGLEQAVTGFWSDDIADYLTAGDLQALFGERTADIDDGLIEKVVAAGLAAPENGRYRVPSPRTLHAAAELIKAGAPSGPVLDIGSQLVRNVDDVVRGFVEAIADQLLRGRTADRLPSTTEVPELAQFLLKIKPLAATAVSAALAHSLDHHVDDVLGDYIARLMPHLKEQPAAAMSSREVDAS